MSENARKMFDIDEQLAKDLRRTLDIISPVITVIREWGKCEEAQRMAKAKYENFKEQLECFEKTISFLSQDDSTRKSLENKCKFMKEVVEVSKQRAKSLEEENRQRELEVVYYMNYSKLQEVNEKIWNKVLETMKIDNDKGLCILFLLHTGKTDMGIKREILNKYFKDYPRELTNDWQSFLDNVK